MPWNPYCKPPGETPAHYSWLRMELSDDTVLGRNIDYAKQQRKEIGQLREEFLGYQKLCGQQKDIDTTRYFRDECAELMKQYRGWDSAIKIIEGDNDYWHSHVSEQIAPYVDRAFGLMELATAEG